MKVFISWSGERGRAIAEILSAWLPSVVQAIKPFFSPDDIATGARWSNEIGVELEASQVGIIVVTRESLSAPWIMFEAGALSKNIGKAKVVPILVDLEPVDVQGPLMQFQCARLDKTDIKRVLRMINSELSNLSLANDILESAFAIWWPELESRVARTLNQPNASENVSRRTERELLEELLDLTRSMARKKRGQKALVPEAPSNSSGPLTVFSIQERLLLGGDLVGANMMGLNLARLNLSLANLRGANLAHAHLSGVRLVDANLDGANLEAAILDGADLSGARISRANFWRASLKKVLNMSLVVSMEDANFFGVETDDDNMAIIARNKTLDIDNYPDLFAYYLDHGMSKADLSELFLWTAHSYPGVPL